MTMISGKLSKWRDYFASANSNIFDIIENAVMVAAIDHPKEFKLRRDRIAELLFTCKITSRIGCDKVELVVPNAAAADDDEGKRKCKNERGIELKGCHVKEKKSEMNVNKISYEETDALSDDIEEESRIVNEVIQIKKIIDNTKDESDSSICESLRKLQVMTLSLEILKETNIGKSVNALRRHNSDDIRNLAKTLLEAWIDMVNEWVDARAEFIERTPESMKPSVVAKEGEGLPSPPLEDLAYISTPTTSIELSQFFDDVDDDGHHQSSGKCNKNHENVQKALVENNNPVRKQQFTNNVAAAVPKDKKDEQPKKQTLVVKPNKPPGGNSQTGRPTKPTFVLKLNKDEMKLQQKSDKSKTQMRPAAPKDKKSEQPKKQTSVVKPNKPSGGISQPRRPTKITFIRKLNNDEMKLQQKLDKSQTQTRLAAPKDKKGEQPKKQTLLVKPNKPTGGNSEPGRPTKPTLLRKLNNDDMKLLKKSDKSKTQMRPMPTQRNKLKCPDEDAANVKLQATKRKLRKRYQEAEKVKRQRTIQVMELQDNPKQHLREQGPAHGNPYMRPGKHLVNRRQ